MDTKQAALDCRGGFLSKLIIYSRGGISAVGRKLPFGMLVVTSLPWGQAGVVASRLSWASLAANDYQIILLHFHSPDRVTRQQWG